MSIDYTDPGVFAVSAAAVSWLVIESIVKPLLAEWQWWSALPDAVRGAVYKTVILSVVTVWGWAVFGDIGTVVVVSLASVLGASGIHHEAKNGGG